MHKQENKLAARITKLPAQKNPLIFFDQGDINADLQRVKF
jgi:hypothetical protein